MQGEWNLNLCGFVLMQACSIQEPLEEYSSGTLNEKFKENVLKDLEKFFIAAGRRLLMSDFHRLIIIIYGFS